MAVETRESLRLDMSSLGIAADTPRRNGVVTLLRCEVRCNDNEVVLVSVNGLDMEFSAVDVAYRI